MLAISKLNSIETLISQALIALDIFDLVNEKIKRKFETNYPTEQQIRKYKKHGSEFIKDIKWMHLKEKICELNTVS